MESKASSTEKWAEEAADDYLFRIHDRYCGGCSDCTPQKMQLAAIISSHSPVKELQAEIERLKAKEVELAMEVARLKQLPEIVEAATVRARSGGRI